MEDVRISNPVPATLARVVRFLRAPFSLGAPGEQDVFVTDASLLRGLTAVQIANRLSISRADLAFLVIEFESDSINGIASPLARTHQGFVAGGRTRGGLPEFVVPNGPIPKGARIWIAW